MTGGKFAFVVASFFTGAAAQTKPGGSELQPKVAVENQKLLTGDSPPIVLGLVKAATKGDNLELLLSLSQEGCFIESSHLCNIPTQTYTASDGATEVPYSIPLFDVYEFVCMYEADFFVIAGHAQVKCKAEIGNFSKEAATKQPLEKAYSYEAYYEIPVECEAAATTAPPLVTKQQLATKVLFTKQPLETLSPLVTKQQLETRQPLETLQPIATKQQIATKAALENEEQVLLTKSALESEQQILVTKQALQTEQKALLTKLALVTETSAEREVVKESENQLVESEAKVVRARGEV